MSINLMYSLSGYFGFWITDIEKMGDRSKCLQIVYKISTEVSTAYC